MRPLHSKLIAAPLIAASFALAACGGGSSGNGSAPKAPTTATVDIRGFKFAPATVTVRTGATLRFVNHDRAEHTATAPGGGFDTGTLRNGQSKTVTAGAPGTSVYRCQFHPFMTGEIVVVK